MWSRVERHGDELPILMGCANRLFVSSWAFASSAVALSGSFRFDFEIMADDEFEDYKAKARAGGETGVKQPEVRGRHCLVEAADPADESVGEEEGQVVKADDGGIDRLGRVFGEEREAYGQEMGEGDAVDYMESDRPKEPDFVARDPSGSGYDEAHHAGD